MFGKNLKKMFGTVLSAAMLISALPAAMPAVYADSYEYLTVSKVLLFRDYEDYTGGPGFGNASSGPGTFDFKIGGNFAKAATKTTGVDGVGVKMSFEGTKTGTWHSKLENPIKDGKLYISFEMQRKSDAVLKEKDGSENSGHMNSIIFNGDVFTNLRTYNLAVNTTHSNATDNNRPGIFTTPLGWNLKDKIADMNEGDTHKIELVTDIKNHKSEYYIDGVKSTYEYEFNLKDMTPYDAGVPWGIYAIGLQLTSGVEYFDNLTLVYCDEKADTAETFSLEGERMYTGGNEIRIKALSDVTDEKSVRAPYGVSLSNDCLKPENFEVKNGDTPVEITGVTRGEKSGEYVLTTKNVVTAGDYTVEASNITDVTGCLTLNTAKNVAKISICDKVFFNETFDQGRAGMTSKYGYEEVAEEDRFQLNNVSYGIEKKVPGIGKLMINTGEFDPKEDVVNLNGNVGLSIKSSAGGSNPFIFKFNETVTSGVVAYSYDIDSLNRTGNSTGGSYTYINRTDGTAGKNNNKNGWYVLAIQGTENETSKATEIKVYPPANGLKGWANDNSKEMEIVDKNKHTIQQVFDLDNKQCYTYVDGELLGTVKTINDPVYKIQDIAIGASKLNTYFDNLRFQFMSTDNDVFKVSADKNVDNAATSVNVTFEDPVAKDQIKVENFEVKKGDTTVTVTGAEWVDPYTAKVSFDALDAGEYTVAAKNIKNAVGASADSAAANFRVKGDGLYKQGFTQDNGTYTVSLANDAKTSKTAVLIAGVFVDGKMVECKTQDTFTTAKEKELASGAEDTLSVTLTQAGTENAVVKVFLWDSLAGAKPLYEQLNK